MNSRRRVLLEVAFAFVIATAAASALYHAQSVAFIHNNLHALVAAIFLVLPQIMLHKRGELERYGFTSHPRALGLAVAAVAIVVVLPLFVGGFALWNRWACTHLPQMVPGNCWRVFHPSLRLPSEMAGLGGALQQIASQLIVVALPEELFFRGYLQGRLEDAFPPKRKLLGAPIGSAFIAASFLFALGHFFVTFEPQMLTRFFPGLAFGWMFARTRSILAGTIFHAACNLLMAILASSFLT